MSEEPAKTARETREYLEDWLTHYREASEAAPTVQQAWELAKWEEDALASAPRGVSFSASLGTGMTDAQTSWQSALAPMPHYDVDRISLSYTGGSAPAAFTYAEIYQAPKLFPGPVVQQWSDRFTGQYEQMQVRHLRREKVRSLLAALSPDRVAEFDEACHAYEGARGGWQPKQQAGITMRNALEHVKGDLWQRARHPQEQRFRWPAMVERLSKAASGSFGYRILLNQEAEHRQLHGELTGVAKNLVDVSPRDIEALWTRFQDHLFVVLSSFRL